MNKTIIVSNRLPIELQFENEKMHIKSSVGGLATGLKSIHSDGDGIWVGWSGITEDELTPVQSQKVDEALDVHKCIRVPLTEYEIENYYHGFSNKALWPLFHYFQAYTEFELEQWDSYKMVNNKFAEIVIKHAEEGDTVWIHDYQLLLLPQLLREQRPDLTIGFFLHIPFPSFELFRTCPWRDELLYGVLGADLIGFHTYDYVRHFLSSTSRLAGLDVHFNEVNYGDRTVKVDFFPMGIDYDRYHSAAIEHAARPEEAKSQLRKSIEQHNSNNMESRLVLSIDRMDYTKGIPNRIKAFEYFLNKYPEFKGKVRLLMLAVPSREKVMQYQHLKRETDELVGRVNGQFATVNWTPIWYFYRSMQFDDLVDLYASSDVAMITPLRDGMNLVAKEYVATRIDGSGVLILSEMAGSAQEMHQALLVNPNNFEQLADSLKTALEMPEQEQAIRLAALQKGVSKHNVERWANAFINSLTEIKSQIAPVFPDRYTDGDNEMLKNHYSESGKKLLLLDYDGTLVGFKDNPLDASPDEELYSYLDCLAKHKDTEIAIISGRDRATLENWFGHKDYTIITDHGVWLRRKSEGWTRLAKADSDWKRNIKPILENFSDCTPGAFVEEKEYSLAWHYRRSDAELAQFRIKEIKHMLTETLESSSLSLLEGNKVLEIKSDSVNKGRAAARLLADTKYDFILSIGDDWTDEFMFEELPVEAYTVKVGTSKTAARYFVKNFEEVRKILKSLC
ncbi:bifunctional alpha,alpha-trehalose-phosphate synthase (UDP-forming)/trehalose-phosphatase [Flavobacterium sp. AG291]|uniref:bifunctional alpha,alpha-trehalose-phosphate synthase (UDP-forming)/trehalose-phosphatase n=1 Tax=Flavobacterium sp. AG291 TaxID=2184000 RepID=UPI000E0B82F6|nr:bifunctional alpha,alpha-trehalose-phosphate synthase (UDP-forming)/trehalose-phosphatase [Flavobacterium sp. AG291]RDI10407.1 trehalose 6-phosphate synthase/phosphatase [Flavobacterium sp. AG291]